MRKRIINLMAVLLISILIGCAHKVAKRIPNANPGSVIVDSSDWNEKEAKELEGLPKRTEGASDDPGRMYLKEMGSVPLLTREEEVEISKRIEKAQIQIEKIIMRFRYSVREAISIANYLITVKERFDKIVAEKEITDKQVYMKLLPRLKELMSKEDTYLESLLLLCILKVQL